MGEAPLSAAQAGVDMGRPSQITVTIPAGDEPITVMGTAVPISGDFGTRCVTKSPQKRRNP